MALSGFKLITIDCADPAELATFWMRMLGGEIVLEKDHVVAVRTDDGSGIAATRVDDYRPPTWPEGERPKQIHLDLAVADLDAAEAEAIEMGARKAEVQPDPARFRVFLDPAGHPFCLCDFGR